jgi:hypothetical protein
MKNSNINLKTQDEKTAKAVAGTIGRFLKDKGVALPHTQALDLVGVLTGHADWRSLSAHLEAEALKQRSRPQVISREEFFKRFKPVKNPFDAHAEFDGYAFGLGGEEYAYVEAMRKADPGRVWTLVDGDVSTWLSSGYHYVNREFYVITHVPVAADEMFEVPYGHDIDDKLYKVSVFDAGGSEIFSEEVYASSRSDAREQLWGSIEDETEELRDEGEAFFVQVDEVVTK